MINFGVIGTGKIVEQFLAAAALVEDFSFTAIYSRTENSAKAFAEKHGAKEYYTNLEEMAKSKSIDAVYIASPNALHCEQTILFLNNKKHVLCEKALASNSREVKKMIEVAKKNQVFLMEAMKTTVTPNFTSIRENLYKIGKIRSYVGNYCQYSSRYDQYKEGIIQNAFKPELSNGAIMDIGVYCIEPMVQLFGKPNTIKATGVMLESGVDGSGSISFGYKDMEAIVIYSKITHSFCSSEIKGEKGSIIIGNMNNFNDVKIHYRSGDVEDISIKQNKELMIYEIEEFIKSLKAREMESKVNSHEVSIKTMEIIDEARSQIGVVYPADQK
ncbi:Gfo/Idh/MocA family protein [Clostridium cellulovorans]|uniref:Oxidoreductase domain protein n=1 Tax=Clostridium cellulovorans (strain ATCC 35296 / DSM 3052 / OCM 3 / 743B) TaxID=573061 RepID=D9SRR1_CLOC7|nr:Gfo/Idh/MocA family oxidoreductase [Clostridium cellulovorans]ADL50428.1 oxidoreductase domain protein [Clostridium cellulovorans 743B]